MPATLLLVVVAVSLTLAATLSVIAWRLAREERRLSQARVEALAAEIHGATESSVVQ